MNSGVASAGLTLAVFVGLVFAFSPRKTRGGYYFSIVSIQGIALFLKELLVGVEHTAHLTTFLIYANFLYGIPAMYLFIRGAYGRGPTKPLRHFVPAIVNVPLAILIAVGGYAVVRIDEPIPRSAHWRDLVPLIYIHSVSALETAQLIIYGLVGIRFIRKRRKQERMNWQSLSFVIVLGCYASYYTLRWMGAVIRLIEADAYSLAPSPPWVGPSMIGIVAIFSGVIGFFAIVGSDGMAERGSKRKKAKYGGTILPRKEAERIVSRAIEFISGAEDISDATISSRRVAEVLKIPYYLLSRAVNEFCGKTVADLIRELRIERAKSLLDKRPEITILEVAFESGFRAKSSFNDAFKRVHGISPSEYRERVNKGSL